MINGRDRYVKTCSCGECLIDKGAIRRHRNMGHKTVEVQTLRNFKITAPIAFGLVIFTILMTPGMASNLQIAYNTIWITLTNINTTWIELSNTLNFTTAGMANCTALETANGTVRCGTDDTGVGGAGGGYPLAGPWLYNTTSGFFNSTYANATYDARYANITKYNTLEANVSALNISTTLLWARELADNASTARTNFENVFTEENFFNGDYLNVSKFINTTALWVSRTNIMTNLSALNVSATALWARQAADNTSLFSYAKTKVNDTDIPTCSAGYYLTRLTNAITCVADQVGIGGNSLYAGGLWMYNNSVQMFFNDTYANTTYDTRYLKGISITLPATNITGTIGDTLLSANITGNLSKLNISTTALWARQSADNTSLLNYAATKVSNTTTISCSAPLSGCAALSNSWTLSFSNTSYSNLDARQKADNASVARTNTNNFFTGNINTTGTVNATVITSYNMTINATGMYWMQGTTCKIREYFNGTHFVTTGVC